MATTRLTRTSGTPTNNSKWTISVWLKRGNIFASDAFIMDAYISANDRFKFAFQSANKLEIWNSNGGSDDAKLDVNAVKQSIKNLILTQPGERPFHPEIGSQIHGLLFENAYPGIEQSLKARILDVLNTYEPRCQVNDILCYADIDGHQYEVTIFFHVIGINEPQELEVALKRLR